MTCVGKFLSHDNPQIVLQPLTAIKNSNETTTLPYIGDLNNIEGSEFLQSNIQWYFNRGDGQKLL